MNDDKSMDRIMALCKRRGFIYQASEIYGGLNGFWDYGPLGAQLKKNLRDAWWEDVVMTGCRGATGPDGRPVRIVPLDTCIIQNPKVWEASGHVAGFNDPLVEDKETHQRFRADHLQGVFRIAGGTQSVEDVAREVVADYRRNWAGKIGNVLPWVTIVASNEHEAVEILERDSKLQKKIRAKFVKAFLSTEEPAAVVVLDQGRGDLQGAVVKPVPYETLQESAADVPSPFTGKPGSLVPPRQFNLMFYSYTGATAGEEDKVYLRPETAQGIFVNFKNVVDTTRVKVPFGIGQTGKAFRNEVTPRNFTFRSREFEMMEVEFFCHPDEAGAWFDFWRDVRMRWWEELGLAGENLTLREHDKDELSHYSTATSDIEYRFPFTAPGFGELEGVAHRGNFDLTQHQEHSGQKLEYFDAARGELAKNGQPKGERYLPHVIEPSAGLDRGVLAALCEAYTVDESRPSPELMRLHPRLAPIKAAVFPLVNKGGMPEVAERLHADLSARFARVGFIEHDAKQSIGKRYARMDEAGCPYCFTIDGETVDSDSPNHNTVTVRDRDTGDQKRIGLDNVAAHLGDMLGA